MDKGSWNPRADSDSLERQMNWSLRGYVQDLHVVARAEGLILQGRSRTYYAKQLAQQELMRLTDQPILVNEIEVCDRPPNRR